MKKFAVLTALCVLPMLAHSASWDSIFQWYITGEDSDIGSQVFEGVKKDIYHNGNVKKSALQGKYPHVANPYRQDMLPARTSVKDGVRYIEIPLKNATLFGLPIANYTHYSAVGSMEFSTFVTFKPMSQAQYRTLKAKKFPAMTSDGCENQTEITQYKGKVYLNLEVSCDL